MMKPKVNNQDLIECLLTQYGIEVERLSFLPIGADFNTAIYQVIAVDQREYFLKLRGAGFSESSALIPSHLDKKGVHSVIPPIETKSGALWVSLERFKLILFPYIFGSNAVEEKLSEQQWVQFGKAVKELHSLPVEEILSRAALSDFTLTDAAVPRETFSSPWCERVHSFLERIQSDTFNDDIAMQAAFFLKSNRDLLMENLEQLNNLKGTIKKQSFNTVMCHADLHGWNLMSDQKKKVYLIDWDTLILAPKERDLMFIGAGIWDSGYSPNQEKAFFYQGYGETDIDHELIHYYRLERIMEDIAVYCEHIFLSTDSSEDRKQSFEYLRANFLPNGTIERASP